MTPSAHDRVDAATRASTLSHDEARAFYDRFGAKQDRQGFYEDVAMERLLRHGRFERAEALFELGCGTGRLAEDLLENHLPAEARYMGVDISETMIELSRRRLERFGSRAEVRLVEGPPRYDLPDRAFDRFVATYVFDLLSPADIGRALREAHRLLEDEGLLCLVSLTHGFTPASGVVVRLWELVRSISPKLVGGCRPISLSSLVSPPDWEVLHEERVSRWGIPSEILVARGG